MKSKRRGSVLSVIAALAALSVVAGLIAGAIALPVTGMAGIAARDAAETFNDLPVPTLSTLPTRSEILSAGGSLIAYYYPNHIYRVPVSYSQIAPVMREAIVAIEDSRFYQHGALDVRGTLRAIATDLTGGQVQGGSTLAQQYVKNALLLTAADSAEQRAAVADSAARKIRELRIAINVERRLTPDQLLAAYLNAAYFENEAYGVEVAAERYFGTTAERLSLTQAAMLAGLVQNPSHFDPLTDPAAARARRNMVLTRMAQLHYISQATAAAAAKDAARRPFLHGVAAAGLLERRRPCAPPGSATTCWPSCGPTPPTARPGGEMNTTGGLKIYTTMNPQDQRAAQNAVSFMLPAPPSGFNPGENAAAEVLIQPGTGHVEAIAVDRPYGTGRGEDSIDYAVDTGQNGGFGVQTGSSSKLFTLITALKQIIPFGFQLSVSSPSNIGPYYNCKRQFTGSFPVSNAEGAGKGTFSLYTGTTQSINVFFAELEQRVGLCNVVKTAVSMGVHRADGGSLLTSRRQAGQARLSAASRRSAVVHARLGERLADDDGQLLTPRVAAGGIYCQPVAIEQITRAPGSYRWPRRAVTGCSRRPWPHAATYILRGVLTSRNRQGRRRHPRRRLRAAGRQDRHGEQLRLRRVRRLHADARRLRVDVQPDRACDASDGRRRVLLPRRLAAGRTAPARCSAPTPARSGS